MPPVAKRDNFCTLSPFALKLCLFRLKYIFKIKKTYLFNFSAVPPQLANARPPGRAKLAKAPAPWTGKPGKSPAVARRGEGGQDAAGLMHKVNFNYYSYS